ncbi:MAG TPA: hypothetical protein VGR65_03550 [Casimicrobiaceae bacterium]|jgi:hypothetical protein|nr:hypothetical protein [Casimicrobiaceae bacterium]
MNICMITSLEPKARVSNRIFDKEGSHDESERRITCSSNRLRTVVGLRDLRHARKHRIRYLPANGPEPAGMVCAIRLQLLS